MSMRMILDGVLLELSDVLPKEVPKGYERDPNNPYRFNIILKACEYRGTIKKKKRNCNCTEDVLYCKAQEKEVTKVICSGCLICK